MKRPSVLLFFVLLALLLTGCDDLLATPTRTATITPTVTSTATATIDWFPATETPTPTQRSTNPTATPLMVSPEFIGRLLTQDDFSDARLWQTVSNQSGNIVYGKNMLSLAVAGNKGSLTSNSQHQLAEKFYLEITANVSLCQPEDQYGVIFWLISTGNAYRVSFNCQGKIRLELLQGGSPVVVQDWTAGRKVMPGAPATQKIGIWVDQGTIQVYVNDMFQFTQKIARDRSGGLSVYARCNGDTAMTVGFSDLKIYDLETNN